MLNSNNLKCIAIICMIIDHIGFFFVDNVDYNTYFLCRSIGRIAMPLFIFLLVEGFFYTKNLKKYIFRIFSIASLTQIIINLFNYIDIKFFYDKVSNLTSLNILFSFTLILIILRCIDTNILKNLKLDYIIRTLIILSCIGIYYIIKIDYGIYGVLIAITFYVLKKYSDKIEKFVKYLIQTTIVVIFSILSINNIIGIFVIISNVLILLYNHNKGKNNKYVSLLFYSIFPLQYMILYIIKLFM